MKSLITQYNSALKDVRETCDLSALTLDEVSLWPLLQLGCLFAHENRLAPLAKARLGQSAYVVSDNRHVEQRDSRQQSAAITERTITLSNGVIFQRLGLEDPRTRPRILLFEIATDHAPDPSGRPVSAFRRQCVRKFADTAEVVPFCLFDAQLSRAVSPPLETNFFLPSRREGFVRNRFDTASLQAINQTCRRLNECVGDESILPSEFCAWTQRVFGGLDAFGDLLDLLQPDAVLVQGYLNMDKLSLGIAAKRRDIPLIDHQHGLFNKSSETYYGPIDIRPDIIQPGPSWFWLWGDYFRQTMPDFIRGPRAVIGGDLTRSDAPETEKRPLRQPGSHAILYLHQATATAYDSSSDGVLPRLIEDMVSATPPESEWLIRLHPRSAHLAPEAEATLSSRFGRRVSVVAPTKADLSDCIENSDSVVTGFSAAAVEARHRTRPVVVTDPVAKSLFGLALDAGDFAYAEHAENAASLLTTMPCRPSAFEYYATDPGAPEAALDAVLSHRS